jgi:GNAT superfamily N-acetyltransferase
MVSAKSRSMILKPLDWTEILGVLRETYWIWSPGLNRELYLNYIYKQMSHRWARKNYRYLGFAVEGRIASSCKLYTLQFRSRERDFLVGGIGAVYTSEDFKGRGIGRDMLKQVVEQCRSSGYDAMLLFSDIGAQYYERLGFRDLGAFDYWVMLAGLDPNSIAKPDSVVRPVEHFDVPTLYRHHLRWLRRQPYGVSRAEDYWHYKLMREIFLHENSKLNWPRLELLTSSQAEGYAILEHSGKILRVLEVIGSPDGQEVLWKEILRLAVHRGAERLRGWEGMRPPYAAQKLYVRTWGCPMLLPFNDRTNSWVDNRYCPLLELDHL